MFLLFFFLKQKTAYEIKECDWSSDGALPIYARRRFGWPSRHQRASQRQKLIGRMFNVLENQIRQIESNEMNLSCDKEVALLGNLARTLEKLIELDTKQLSEQKPEAGENKAMKVLMEKLAARISQLEQE